MLEILFYKRPSILVRFIELNYISVLIFCLIFQLSYCTGAMACENADVIETTREVNVLSRMREDREASELLIALFLSACRSFKYHSLVRPCPPDYIEMSSSLHQSTDSQEKQKEVVS